MDLCYIGEAEFIDGLLPKFRNDIGNVIPKHFVRGENRHILGRETVFEAVEQKCDPVQGDGSFAGAGSALDDQCACIFIPDNFVLLLLDGGDDGFHLLVGSVGKFFLKHIILDIGSAFQGIFHDAVFDLKLSFSGQISLNPSGRGIIARRACFIVVKHTGYRGAPVIDQHFTPAAEGKAADVYNHFFPVIAFKINPGKIRGVF